MAGIELADLHAAGVVIALDEVQVQRLEVQGRLDHFGEYAVAKAGRMRFDKTLERDEFERIRLGILESAGF